MIHLKIQGVKFEHSRVSSANNKFFCGIMRGEWKGLYTRHKREIGQQHERETVNTIR